MAQRKLMHRIAEVSYEGRIDEYEVVAYDNIEARDLIVKFLAQDDEKKGIRVRELPVQGEGAPRVIGKVAADPK
ncbi:hypothetical protein [Methylobacterium sp. CM6257]